jgi:hypothetical protein
VLYRDGRAVGRIRHGNPELTEALNLADGLARSPASIATSTTESFISGNGTFCSELREERSVMRRPSPRRPWAESAGV